MARPRNDQEGPGARERMQEAFWELLREKSFAKITVGDVARTAQVNRNAFYYHFDNTLEQRTDPHPTLLADKGVHHRLESQGTFLIQHLEHKPAIIGDAVLPVLEVGEQRNRPPQRNPLPRRLHHDPTP